MSEYTYDQWSEISDAVADAMEYAHDKAIEYPDKADPLWNLDEYVNRILKVAFSGEEIVRCRDCKHMHTVRHWLGMDVDECWLHADRESGALGKERTEPDGFCAWGERKVDE